MKTALVLGAAGFIGKALCARLKAEGALVYAVDHRASPFGDNECDHFSYIDLRKPIPAWLAHPPGHEKWDEVYQLAADMGGAGYIFTGQHDAEVIRNNVKINANVAEFFAAHRCGRLLFTSSSCVYNDALGLAVPFGHLREDGSPRPIFEGEALRLQPSSSYGREKLFSEEMYRAHKRNHGLNVCITRFSTIYGPGSAFDGGRENAVAAICRKVLAAPSGGEVEVWGDGRQVRPLVYIDDLLDAIIGLARCKTFDGPVNIANIEETTCDEIARHAIALSGKKLTIKHVPGPTGKQVLRLTTDLAEKHLGWKATTPFAVGVERTFEWIAGQMARRQAA